MAAESTYPMWKLTAVRHDGKYTVETTSDEDRIWRRFRTHSKIGTNPELRRQDTPRGKWKYVA